MERFSCEAAHRFFVRGGWTPNTHTTMNHHTHKPCSRRARSAFTLVELLVTITIVISLAALMLNGLARFRAASAKTISMGNLKQLQLANATYAADHNGKFVSIRTRDGEGKLGNLWILNPSFLENLRGELASTSTNKPNTSVPISLLDPIAVRAKASNYDDLRGNYGGVVGPGHNQASSDSSYTMSQLVAPERTAAFTTATDWQVVYGGRFNWAGVEGRPGTPAGTMAYRHGDKALVVFYDGHVGEVSKNDIRALDKQGGASNLFWSGTGK